MMLKEFRYLFLLNYENVIIMFLNYGKSYWKKNVSLNITSRDSQLSF